VDFSIEPPLAGFHMTIVAGEEECLLHRSRMVRIWDPAGLEAALLAGGFAEARVSGRLGDPDAEVAGEDVFVHAVA
jgi:hypothetical protein